MAGCGPVVIAGHILGGVQPDTLTIVRRNPLHQQLPPLPPTVRVHDPTVVRQFYADVLTLPAMPRGPIDCPADFGVTYHLTFIQRGSVVLTANADGSGCEVVRLSNGSVLWAVPQPGGAAFRNLLARTLGLSPKQLTGVPPPTSQSTPPVIPSPPPPAGAHRQAPTVGTTVYRPAVRSGAPSTPASGHPGQPPALRFIVENGGNDQKGWPAPLLPRKDDMKAISEVAALLDAAAPAPVEAVGTAGLRCGSLGLMTITPPPTTAAWWEIGLPDGRVLPIAPDVVACNTAGKTIASKYALIGGRPMKAPGLLNRLRALTWDLPRVPPLTVAPETVSPGETIRVSGEGWVGPPVKIELGSCPLQGRCVAWTLATVPVDAAGRISWSGPVPLDVPPSSYPFSVTLGAENAVRSVGGVRLDVH